MRNPDRGPALTIAEMHNRYGDGRGECYACRRLHQINFDKKLHTCPEAVPESEWRNPAYRWDPQSPACGIKKV